MIVEVAAEDGLRESFEVADVGGSLHLHLILRITRQEWLAKSACAQAVGCSFEDTIASVVADIAVENNWWWGDKVLDVRQIKTGEDTRRKRHIT